MAGLIVQEWIEESGGAEQVLEGMRTAFPEARVACLWNDDPGRFPPDAVDESWLARTPLRGRKALEPPAHVRHLAPRLGYRSGARLGADEQLRLRAPRRLRHARRRAEVLLRPHARAIPLGARPGRPDGAPADGPAPCLAPRRRSTGGPALGLARRQQRLRARPDPPCLGPRRAGHPPAGRRDGDRRGRRVGRAHDARRAGDPRGTSRPRLPHGGLTPGPVQAPRRGARPG